MNKHGLYEIYHEWHTPFWQTAWFYYAVVASGVCVFLLILYLIVKKLRAKKSEAPPWKVALRLLAVLKDQEIVSPEQGKDVYFLLTEILKKYFTDQYELDVQGKTDGELAIYLATTDLPKSVAETMDMITEGATLIKFANQQAMQKQIEKDLERAVGIIKRTIPEQKK